MSLFSSPVGISKVLPERDSQTSVPVNCATYTRSRSISAIRERRRPNLSLIRIRDILVELVDTLALPPLLVGGPHLLGLDEVELAGPEEPKKRRVVVTVVSGCRSRPPSSQLSAPSEHKRDIEERHTQVRSRRPRGQADRRGRGQPQRGSGGTG